jgi:tetratricopeptide (TPR) repeat protein
MVSRESIHSLKRSASTAVVLMLGALVGVAARAATPTFVLGQRRIVAEPTRAAGAIQATVASPGQRLLQDCADGKLDEFSPLAAGLIASGAETEAELNRWLEMYFPVREAILAGVPAGTAIDRLKAIHHDTHRFVLTGYYKSITSDIRTTIENGDFNCLTSLLVQWDLCQAAGIDVQAQLVHGHIFLSFTASSGQSQAIEPGSSQWLSRPLGEISGCRPLSWAEVIAKFYYNRGLECLNARRYSAGIDLLRTSLMLDAADGDTRANLAAGLNNWAVEQCRQQRYGDAAKLIDQGLAIDPSSAPLIANRQLVRSRLSSVSPASEGKLHATPQR